jgi:hypothetical protein
MSDEQENKIITPGDLSVDSDWKAEAKREKERLAKQRAEASAQAAAEPTAGDAPADPAAQRNQVPEANFQTLVSQTVTQAMYAMGMIPDPQTGRRVAMVDLARYHVDMLGVLEEKTRGNLSADEEKLLATSLYELRMQYVQLAQQAIAQQTGADQR